MHSSFVILSSSIFQPSVLHQHKKMMVMRRSRRLAVCEKQKQAASDQSIKQKANTTTLYLANTTQRAISA
jgi:hypothetical protein